MQHDAQLVERCLTGDELAWQQMYAEQHPLLLAQVNRLLFADVENADIAEEVAARVWQRLLEQDCRDLARFDVERACRLSTYLGAMAANEVLQFLRAERRLQARSIKAGQIRLRQKSRTEIDLMAPIHDFLTTLSPRERDYCRKYLLAWTTSTSPCPLSAANVWQLRHRIKRKLLAFLEQE